MTKLESVWSISIYDSTENWPEQIVVTLSSGYFTRYYYNSKN